MENKWSEWKPMPSPETCRQIEAPNSPGVYQIRNVKTNQNILFGIGTNCQKRMKSLFPKPYGVGTRNNEAKRLYVLTQWRNLEYRTLKVETRMLAKTVEDDIKAKRNHLFNT